MNATHLVWRDDSTKASCNGKVNWPAPLCPLLAESAEIAGPEPVYRNTLNAGGDDYNDDP